jgi:hypothetical protein
LANPEIRAQPKSDPIAIAVAPAVPDTAVKELVNGAFPTHDTDELRTQNPAELIATAVTLEASETSVGVEALY